MWQYADRKSQVKPLLHSLQLTTLGNRTFENIVGEGENAPNNIY